MAHAAKTYARLVARGGALVKNVDIQVQTSMEWLQGGKVRWCISGVKMSQTDACVT